MSQPVSPTSDSLSSASETSCRTYTYPQGTFIAPASTTVTSSDSDSAILNAFLANPTVHRSADNKGYQCPLCPQVFLDSYSRSTMSSSSSSSPSSLLRRQVRTEALKEHLGVKHNLLPKHPCPFRNDTKCKSSPHGFVKCHRLANHMFDNALCRASAVSVLDAAAAVSDADSDASAAANANVDDKIDTIRWALGPNARTCTVAELRELFMARAQKRLGAAASAASSTASAGAKKGGKRKRRPQPRVAYTQDVENHPPPTSESWFTDTSSESSSSGSSNKRRRTMASRSEVEFRRFWNQLHSDPHSSTSTHLSASSHNDNSITFTVSPPTSPTSTLGGFSDIFSSSTSADAMSSFSSTTTTTSSSATASPCPFQSIQVPTPQPSPLVLPTNLANSVPAPMDPLMLAALGAAVTGFDTPIIHTLAPPPATSVLPLELASTLDCGLFYPPPLPLAVHMSQISPFALAPRPPAATTTPSFSDFDATAAMDPATIALALTYAPMAVAAVHAPDEVDALSAYLFGPPTPPASPAVGQRVRLTSIRDQVLAGSAASEMGEEGVDPVLLALFRMDPRNEEEGEEVGDKAGRLERCLSISDVLLGELL